MSKQITSLTQRVPLTDAELMDLAADHIARGNPPPTSLAHDLFNSLRARAQTRRIEANAVELYRALDLITSEAKLTPALLDEAIATIATCHE